MRLTLLAVAGTATALAVSVGSSAGTSSRPTAASDAQRAAPATLVARGSRFGRVLFDGRGRVLYAFTRDRRGGPSRCYDACARAWPVYFAGRGSLRAGAGVERSLLGTVRRRDGRRQITYNGWPLYYYAHEGPGEIKCQNVDQFGGLWLVVRPTGRLVR